MSLTTQTRRIGAYTANLLGNIRSHLAGLQGYDVMALELIQNADDAKAEEIVFDITSLGLLVRNSGRFTYCGDLETRPCGLLAASNSSCDYHRIADVGSGGKLSNGENIGRFGIGFVSTYQVTDHPEIRSSGIKLTLRPEEGQWLIEPFDEPDGTTFFLPWADDPNTEVRRGLGVSHVSAAHIDQLAEDFQMVLRSSLLFLRHVRKAELRRNGALLLACDLDRGDSSELIVSFRPSGTTEHWHILRADAAGAAKRLYAIHPRLKGLDRSTRISIGLRIDPGPIAGGLLYAFLPTEQSTGLPLHINADFFPESDRKAVIFAGHQHEQSWNEMLIDAAAAELARDPEGLLKSLGHVQLWQILSRAWEISTRTAALPPCFKSFWERLKASGVQAKIALAHDGSVQRPGGVFLSRAAMTADQANTLLEIGGRLATEELRPFHTAMGQLGAPILNLERLVALLEAAIPPQAAWGDKVDEQRLKHFYRPLWSIINDLLPDAAMPGPSFHPILARLLAIPFVVTEDLFTVTINQSYVAPSFLNAGQVTAVLPSLAVASKHVLAFPKIIRLIRSLGLGDVAAHISKKCVAEPIEDVISVQPNDLRDLYTLFATLDRHSIVQHSVYQTLRGLPIWLSGRGLIRANHALLPGNFTDPTGQADLLDPTVLTESAKEFVSSKLGVKTQTIEAFVLTVLPTFFNDTGPREVTTYTRLITELARHTVLVNDERIRQLLGSLPIVPTQDGRWSCPTNTYRRTEELVRILGDSSHLWLDVGRLPHTRSVQTFVDSLGIRKSPIARHLVDRMLNLAEKYSPTDQARRASAETFYVLCDNYKHWKGKEFFESAISDLGAAACFPAEGDTEHWHPAYSLHVPYRAEAFRSQARILDFGNRARLNTELLEELDFVITLETSLVIRHLQYCVSTGVPAHVSIYQVLNERVQSDGALIEALAGTRCIYVEGQKTFVRPNQLYWSPQQLGRFAFTIPKNLETLKPLLGAIGVKNAPEGTEFVDILLDIVEEYFVQSKPVIGTDRSVYDICLKGMAAANSEGQLLQADMERMQKAPSILNLKGQPTHPDEVLLQDSEWHAGFFGSEIDAALCQNAPERWPMLEKFGVRRLSKSARVEREFVDGPQVEEREIADKLRQRVDVLARLLHDKPFSVRFGVRKALGELQAVSYDVVRIQASVQIGDNVSSARPISAQAFYEIEQRRLILARPVGERIWSHVLNALFHQLMPEESGSEISKLTLSMRPLMGMSVEDADRELSDADIPRLPPDESSGDTEDLASVDIGNIGDGSSPVEEDSPRLAEVPVGDMKTRGNTLEAVAKGTADPTGKQGAHSPKTPSEPRRDPIDRNDSPRTGYLGVTGSSVVSNTGSDVLSAGQRVKGSRPKHKEQWDRRLLSYVRQRRDRHGEGSADGTASDHNREVEVVARVAVCQYEKSRGRLPEQMAQTHPGYDIISRNALTGEERFIEVKGVDGEWNKTGVSLSRFQFSNAQEYGDRFWLYVVEFVFDPQHIRVHPIQSPAMQVASFMFDGNWRDAVTDEIADPSLAFIAGARVNHQQWGYGHIVTAELRGSTRVMSIEFEKYGRRTVTLNLLTMSVVKDDDGNDPP